MHVYYPHKYGPVICRSKVLIGFQLHGWNVDVVPLLGQKAPAPRVSMTSKSSLATETASRTVEAAFAQRYLQHLVSSWAGSEGPLP